MFPMTNPVTRNLLVSAGLSVGLCLLVTLQTLFFASQTSAWWWLAIAASAFPGFCWANARAYGCCPPTVRALAVGATVLIAWGLALLVAATLSVNLKFALGGSI